MNTLNRTLLACENCSKKKNIPFNPKTKWMKKCSFCNIFLLTQEIKIKFLESLSNKG